MAEALKNLYSKELISSLSDAIQSTYEKFEIEQFTTAIFDSEWDKRELKGRMRHISLNLQKHLPENYTESVQILKTVAAQFNGFQYMFFPGFVELYGINHYEESIKALELFTEFSSSEFAVRPFIKKYPVQMMSQMEKWSKSKNHHVRRLASEGCRPRLPWATALTCFKDNPKPILRVLENLKNDDSEYVRKSVANNLNDISKDNPKVVISLAKQWLSKSDNTDKIIRHACRTLLKQGNHQVLNMFGFQEPAHIKITNFKVGKQVKIGGYLEFHLTLTSVTKALGKLRVEYGIGFMKNNAKLSRKIFKLSESNCSAKTKTIAKKHSFKVISTRKYYTGKHDIVVIINGKELASGKFKVY